MDISTHDTIVPGELRHKLIIISYFSKLKKLVPICAKIFQNPIKTTTCHL